MPLLCCIFEELGTLAAMDGPIFAPFLGLGGDDVLLSILLRELIPGDELHHQPGHRGLNDY